MQTTSIIRWQVFEKALLSTVVVDLALGGNGYLFRFGGWRLREILMPICMAWVVARLTCLDRIRLNITVTLLIAFFIFTTALSGIVGYLQGSTYAAVLAELKPLSYFPMLAFFSVAIRSRRDVSLVITILLSSGCILAVLYDALMLAGFSGLLDYTTVYNFLRPSDEFIFRFAPVELGGPFVGFFYKGAFYVCVASLFVIFGMPHKMRAFFAVATLLAAAMTNSRGLGVALLAAIIIGAAFEWHSNKQIRTACFRAGLASLLLAASFVSLKIERLSLESLSYGFLQKGSVIATSASLRSVAVGDLQLPIEPHREISVGERLNIANTGAYPPTKVMIGMVSSYEPKTGDLHVVVAEITGNSNPDNFWIISRSQYNRSLVPVPASKEVATSAAFRRAAVGRMELPTRTHLRLNPGTSLIIQNALTPPTVVMTCTVISYEGVVLVADVHDVQGTTNADNYWLIYSQGSPAADLPAEHVPQSSAGSDIHSAQNFELKADEPKAPPSDTQNVAGTRSVGDATRINDIRYVIEHLTPLSLLVGHGLGSPIDGRDRVEVNYAEIVHKQGLLGLAGWIALFAVIFVLFCDVRKSYREALPLFLSSVFVYVSTATNTFLTGSIGMGVVFISLASLLVLKNSAAANPVDRTAKSNRVE